MVMLPAHLRTLAAVGDQVAVRVDGDATVATVLDAIERDFPVLRGTIRDHVTRKRRPFLRFFADGIDLSHQATDLPLPDRVAAGEEPFLVIGAIAGG